MYCTRCSSAIGTSGEMAYLQYMHYISTHIQYIHFKCSTSYLHTVQHAQHNVPVTAATKCTLNWKSKTTNSSACVRSCLDRNWLNATTHKQNVSKRTLAICSIRNRSFCHCLFVGSVRSQCDCVQGSKCCCKHKAIICFAHKWGCTSTKLARQTPTHPHWNKNQHLVQKGTG
jgi:hypothetical protein